MDGSRSPKMHPSLADAFDFANYQIEHGREVKRVASAFVTVAGALVHKKEAGNPNKAEIVEALVRLLRAACDGPDAPLPQTMELQ